MVPLVPRTPVEVLSACGGSRSTAPEARVTVMEPRLFVCKVSTALLALLCPATAGCAAGPPNPMATPVEVLSGGVHHCSNRILRRLSACRESTALLSFSFPSIAGGSRSSAPEASLILTLDPPPLIALKPRLIARRVPTALLSHHILL